MTIKGNLFPSIGWINIFLLSSGKSCLIIFSAFLRKIDLFFGGTSIVSLYAQYLDSTKVIRLVFFNS